MPLTPEQLRRAYSHAYLRGLWRFVEEQRRIGIGRSVTDDPLELDADAVHAELQATAALVVARRHRVRLASADIDGLGRTLRGVTAQRLEELRSEAEVVPAARRPRRQRPTVTSARRGRSRADRPA